jgi:hypothetical protein
MKTPPGWYPDPKHPLPERYWDGEYWTSRVRTSRYQRGEVVEPEHTDETRGIRSGAPETLYSSYEPDVDVFVTSFNMAVVFYLTLLIVNLSTSPTNSQMWNFGFLLAGYLVNAGVMFIRFKDYPLPKPKRLSYKLGIAALYIALIAVFHYLFHIAH